MKDGSHRCVICKTDLNETDKNCWRCGSKDILQVVKPCALTTQDQDQLIKDEYDKLCKEMGWVFPKDATKLPLAGERWVKITIYHDGTMETSEWPKK